ncbi:MAG TPA: transaldolase family protein [Methylomirabilota bacterium]|nr:transaldolase family protein [Methylomirabilota bacterium]
MLGRAVTERPDDVSVHHIIGQIENDQTLAAADHILVRASKQDTPAVIRGLLTALPEFMERHPELGKSVFTTLIRIGLNLVGRDVYVAKFPETIIESSSSVLIQGIRPLEEMHHEDGNAAVDSLLADMSSVNNGDSLPAYIAEKIKKSPDYRKPSRFIEEFGRAARGTVYWKMVEGNFCKFGNDYARGLETLRHLGFSQVSTNPVLAAKAFDEDKNLVTGLTKEISKNPAWKADPRSHAHEMVMAGTLLALWPNLEVFRPLAVLVNNQDYMVSFQLNPNVADDSKASLEDAKRAYALAREHLTAYDRSLGIETPGKVAPNIVFKVAASAEAAREVTLQLNASGIGTNNTVTFAVSQEVPLMIDALVGKARAISGGRPVTRTYMTNMGGRFVSHLREEEAKRILLEVASHKGEADANRIITRLAEKLKLPSTELARVEQAANISQKADIVCAFKNMKSLAHEAFLEAASQAGLSKKQVEDSEIDLRKAGTLVARKVYLLFYEKSNREKWLGWLEKQHKLTRAQAVSVLDSMDILPASKRVPEDTLDTLASINMCNTEFPNHARAVQVYSETDTFDLTTFREATLRGSEPGLVTRLSSITDFVKGYESTLRINEEVHGTNATFPTQLGGMEAPEWTNFGPVKKTMTEFKGAYDAFLERCVELVGKIER